METTPLDQDNNEKPASTSRPVIAKPDYSDEPQAISRFTSRADYPECLRSIHVDIRGFAGVVVEIVNQSIRVLSSEGILQSFNFNRLKTLNSPPSHAEAMPSSRPVERTKSDAAPEPEQFTEDEPPVFEDEDPERVYIAEPDFTLPFKKIDDLAGQPDFPQCIYGVHVDIRDFTGVVVEIVKGSLKIQSPDGVIRSYNAGVLKKLYGNGGGGSKLDALQNSN